MNLTITKIANFLGHKNALYKLHKISDKAFYSAGSDGMLVKWDISKPEDGLLIANAQQAIYSLVSFDNFLLLGLKNGTIHVINTQTQKEEKQLIVADNSIFCLEIYGNLILIGTESGVIYVMNQEFEIVKKKRVAERSIRSMCVIDGLVYAGSTDNRLYCLDRSLNEKKAPISHPDTVFALAQVHNTLVTGCKDARMRIIDMESWQIAHRIDAHWYHVKSLDKNPKFPLILSTSMDKTIRIWDTQTWELLKVIDKEKNDGHSSSVNCGLWLTENTVISCSDDRSIQAFHLEIVNT